ncbi:g3796 [Coccomyxa elongata]
MTSQAAKAATPTGTRRLRGTLSFRNDNIHFVVLREGLEARLRRVDDNIGRIYCVSNDQMVDIPDDVKCIDTTVEEELPKTSMGYLITFFDRYILKVGDKEILHLEPQKTQSMLADPSVEAGTARRFVLPRRRQRRLRIQMLRLEVAKVPAEVYADAILLLLFHKITIAAAAQGASEGRALLHDWLVLSTASYNRHKNAHTDMADQVDAEFEGSEAICSHCCAWCTRCCALLTEGKRQKGEHPDLRAAICHLSARLPPRELRSAVYLFLSSFSNPDTLTSLLRCNGNAVCAARRLTLQLCMLREGIDDVAPFMQPLIEEPEMGAGGKVALSGMAQFLYNVQMEVWEYLQEQGYGK